MKKEGVRTGWGRVGSSGSPTHPCAHQPTMAWRYNWPSGSSLSGRSVPDDVQLCPSYQRHFANTRGSTKDDQSERGTPCGDWEREQDLNLRSAGYEPAEIDHFSIPL